MRRLRAGELSGRAGGGILAPMRTLLVALALLGCSDPPTPPAPEAPVESVLDEPPVIEDHPPAPEPPALGDEDLDAMDEPALEAACFAGSSAACDRLGH